MFGNSDRRPREDETVVPHGLIWQAMKKEPSQAERLESDAEKPRLEVVPLQTKPSEPPDGILAAIPALEHPESGYETSTFWQRLPQPAPEPLDPAPEPLDLDVVTPPVVPSRTFAGLLGTGHTAVKSFLQAPGSVQAASRDSRLWTSFALAGITALLVLVFTSTLQHRAMPNLPAQVLHASSPSGSAPPQPAGIASQKPISRPQAARPPNHAVIAPPSRPDEPRALKPASRAKPRRTEDDDYVAPDTFVTYYNPRSRSR